MAPLLRLYHTLNTDPRHWQLIALAGLFLLSNYWGSFGGGFSGLAAAGAGALLAQAIGSYFTGAPWQWKSASITALSLSILLRASAPWVWLLAGFVAIALKFTLRWRGKHIFNPACIGIVVAVVLSDGAAWISPGQWGQIGWFIAFTTGFAALVLSSAKRLDIALGFLIATLLIGLARAIYLGDPLIIPFHKMQNGALLVFAFFMITDPRSTPDARAGRLIFAGVVAGLAAWLSWQFHLRGAMLFALALCAPLTPILDTVWKHDRFIWRRQAGREHVAGVTAEAK